MLKKPVSAYLFLAASILLLVAAVISVFNESSMDTIFLGVGLLCGLISKAMFQKHKQAIIHFST